MKKTVLHATPERAESISRQLLEFKTGEGEPLFSRSNTPAGFQIVWLGNEKKPVVFLYETVAGIQWFHYDEALLDQFNIKIS